MTDIRTRAAEAVRELRAHADAMKKGGLIGRGAKSNARAALLEELAGMVPEWRPISEAPKDGKELLLAARDSTVPDRWYRGVGQSSDETEVPGTVAGWFWSFAIRPTHWQPLPPPPTQAEEK